MAIGTIAGELVLRVKGEEVSLGHIQVPVRVRSNDTGELILTASTREVRDVVQELYGAAERAAREHTEGGES